MKGSLRKGSFHWGISRISKISKFSRNSRQWSDSPLFSTLLNFSRISKFSRISRKLTFLKRPVFPIPTCSHQMLLLKRVSRIAGIKFASPIVSSQGLRPLCFVNRVFTSQLWGCYFLTTAGADLSGRSTRKTSTGKNRLETWKNSQKLLPVLVLNVGEVSFSLTTPQPPIPRQTPRPSHPEKLDFGPFWLRLAPFRLRLAPFRVCFGSVSGAFWVLFGVLGGVGVGSGRGASAREKNITMLNVGEVSSQQAFSGSEIGLEQSRLKFSIPLENFNLAWNFQFWPSEFPTKNGGLVGGLLEMFNSRSFNLWALRA